MYVYLVGNAELKWYKIGFSRRPLDKRLKEVQDGVPFKVDLLGHWMTEQAFTVEQMTHEKFWSKHLRGEWFENLDIVEVAVFIQEKARILP